MATILDDSTVRADAAHYVRCYEPRWERSIISKAHMLAGIGETALRAAEEGRDAGELAPLVRSARHRARLLAAARRDRRGDVAYHRDVDHRHALANIGRAVLAQLRPHLDGCRCSLHEHA